MRATDFLTESPFLEPGEMLPPAVMRGPYPSTENLKREFNFLGSLMVGDTEYNFWINKGKTKAIVTTVSTEHELNDNSERQLLCCELKFYQRVQLPVTNQLQVSRVYTHPDHRTNWLAGALYIVLARYGYTIVSDAYQYIPGKQLWKSLARDSDMRNYRVFIWNQRTSDWVRDSNNKPVRYDTNNIYDSDIWHNVNDQSTSLLVLTKDQVIEEGKMKPLTADGKEKAGSVAELKRRLITAKKNKESLSYDAIDSMMQKICRDFNLTGDKLHDDFVAATDVTPDDWIKSKQVDESQNSKYLGATEKVKITKKGRQVPLNKRGFGT